MEGRKLMMFRVAAVTSAMLLLATGIATAQDSKPTDPQIAHIAYTAGQIDIEAAKLALKKSKNKQVRDFAQDMVRDHTAVNDKALALVKKLNVTPEDNPTSKALLDQAKKEHAALSKLNGKAFDKAYATNEVETTLIPSATNSELKDLLGTGLKIFQGHEQHAEHLAAELK
jgi:putative membrane protein